MISDKLKILDCTLREGGYVNNWDFGFNNILDILNNLIEANIDYVECGFLKSVKYDKNKSLFSVISQLQKLIQNNPNKSIFTLMINYGEYDLKNIPECNNDKILFRVAFKKNQMKNAIEYSKQLQEKGYRIFINPMHTNIYSKEELLYLIEEVNKFQPYGFTITDTTGSMTEKDVVSIFDLADRNLEKNAVLCFHSHNNLQLSFSNALSLIKINKNRELIIDSTLKGIGRGAGNLCTEIIAQYLDKNFSKNYDVSKILKLIDEQINPIFNKNPWGYSVPYYISAIYKCHPNYAKYLIDRHVNSAQIVAKFLKFIPDNKRTCYDEKIIEQIYFKNKK